MPLHRQQRDSEIQPDPYRNTIKLNGNSARTMKRPDAPCPEGTEPGEGQARDHDQDGFDSNLTHSGGAVSSPCWYKD